MLNSNSLRYISIALIVIGLAGVGYLFITQGQGVSMARAQTISENYLKSMRDSDLEIDEVMEFEYNYYVIYYEKSTGTGAFEMLIDKSTGRIYPEYGPNMMWNLKYGHGGMMGGSGGMMGPGGMMGGYGYYEPGAEAIGVDEAVQIAQLFLDKVYPGAEAEDAHPFYGYYTIHTMRNGEITGMLSVNQYTGAVWYHNWHGAYITSVEAH